MDSDEVHDQVKLDVKKGLNMLSIMKHKSLHQKVTFGIKGKINKKLMRRAQTDETFKDKIVKNSSEEDSSDDSSKDNRKDLEFDFSAEHPDYQSSIAAFRKTNKSMIDKLSSKYGLSPKGKLAITPVKLNRKKFVKNNT